MIISKMLLNPQEAVHGGSYRSAPALSGRSVYDGHQALWAAFSDGPDRRRDFLYREIAPNAFLAVSVRPPVSAPLLWKVQSKAYDPQLRVGERLHFSLRVNPVRKTRDDDGRQVRHDVVQHARTEWKKAHGKDSRDMPSRMDFARQAGWDWLAARAAALGLALGADDEALFAVERYEPCVFYKKGAGKVTVTQLDMTGFATVADPDALKAALFQGVGCAKGFGCGLLLIQRAR